MIAYRGIEDKPETEYLKTGFTNHPVYMKPPQDQLQEWFLQEVAGSVAAGLKDFRGKVISGKVRDLGAKWRAATPGGLIATAATEEGAYDHKPYVYRIEYPDEKLWAWMLQNDGTPIDRYLQVGGQVHIPDSKEYLLLANNMDLDKADVLALYHGVVNTREVTFFTPILRDRITGWREGGVANRGKYKPMP